VWLGDEVSCQEGDSDFQQSLQLGDLGKYAWMLDMEKAAPLFAQYYEMWSFVLGELETGQPFSYIEYMVRSGVGKEEGKVGRGVLGLALFRGGAAVMMPSSRDPCGPSEPSLAYLGPAKEERNETHITYCGGAGGCTKRTSSPMYVSIALNNLDMRMEDAKAGLQTNIRPFGDLYNFSYSDIGGPGAYVQLLGRATGTLEGVPFVGMGGIERHVGYNTWGNGRPFLNWYTHWLLSASLSDGMHGLSIVGSDGFSGGYYGGELLPPPRPSAPPSLTCNATLFRSIHIPPIPLFTASGVILNDFPLFTWEAEVSSDTFSWWEENSLPLLSPSQRHTGVFGKREVLEKPSVSSVFGTVFH